MARKFVVKNENWIRIGEARRPVPLTDFMDHVIEHISRGKCGAEIAREYSVPWNVIRSQLRKLGLDVHAIRNGEGV
jgi:hypothetical protein